MLCAGVVLGPVAYFLGGASLTRIRLSGGTVGGERMAAAGRTLGAVVTLIWALIDVLFVILTARGVLSGG